MTDDTISLRQHIELLLVERDKALTLALSSQEKALQLALAERDKALALAATANEVRLEGMNEFRRQLDKQAGTFATNETIGLKFNEVDRRIALIELTNSNLQGRFWALGAGITVFTTIFVVAVNVLFNVLRLGGG